jgi:putative (di)nucleoside polyphosphate hydrolase
MTSSAPSIGYRPCVGIMVLNRDGLVWIGRRPDAKDSPEGAGSWWQMPQGGIDADEDPARAAHRELVEETGMTSVQVIAESADWHTYDLPAELQGKVWGGRYRGQRQKWIAMRFLGPDSEVNITPPAGLEVEFDMWRWVPASEVTGLIVPFKRAVYERVVAEFAPLARPL